MLRAPGGVFYYRNDPSTQDLRYKWIGVSLPSLELPLRSAAESRLMPDTLAAKEEIDHALDANCIYLSGKTFVLTDHWLAGNICHMLFDHFYRYWLTTKVQLEVDHFLVIGEAWGWMRFVAEELLGVANIKYINPGVAYKCQDLYFWSNSFPEEVGLLLSDRALRHPANGADPDYLAFLRSKFIRSSFPAWRSGQNCYTGRLFISRKENSLRSFANIRAIEEYFRFNGFDVEYLEDYAPVYQIRLMRNRSHVAGLHGAGLTNLLAVDQGTSILEIFSDRGTNSYFKVMKALGNQYQRVDNQGRPNPLVLDIAFLEEGMMQYLRGVRCRLPRIIADGFSRDQAAELIACLRRSGYRSRFSKSCGRLRRETFMYGGSRRCHVLFVRNPCGRWRRGVYRLVESLGQVIPAFGYIQFQYRKNRVLLRLKSSGYAL